jgi:hypothetical protein
MNRDSRRRHHQPSEKVAALLLSALLVSCSATRHISPSSPEELARLVLFIKELPDGTVIHSWQHAEELDLSQYRFLASAHRPARSIIMAAGWNRDCDEENRECIRECMSRPLPRGYGHMTSNGTRGAKVEWLKRNRKEILVGSVIVIAGVAFIAVSVGAGVVILAPALLLAVPGTEAEPVVAQGTP